MNIWLKEGSSTGSLAVVSDDAIVTGELNNDVLEDTISRIKGGESPLNILAKKATHIPFFNIRCVQFDEHEEEIEITYQEGKENKSTTIDFENKADRTDAFQLMENRLGDNFTSLTESYSKLRAVYAPLLTLTIFGFLTWLFHGAAKDIASGAEADFSGKNSGIKAIFFWILDVIGPIGALVVGGLLMALAVMALIQRFKEPPIITKLQEGPQSPSRGIGTVIKYAILVGLWYLFLPPIFNSIFS
jgi:hypothetical protein